MTELATDADDRSVEPIAIVGVAARVPGAGDVETFWANLIDGVESVRFSDRTEQAALGVPDSVLDDPSFVPAALVLEDMDAFDAEAFGMTRREAELCDPQQRLFLELARTALDDAGCDPARFDGSIGVFGGKGNDDYLWLNLRTNRRVMNSAGNGSVSVGNLPDYLATWTSYKLDLAGPSLTVQTACSTGLVATHLACEALRSGECELALAGGVCIEFPHGHGYLYFEGGVNSSDGHCRPFDAAADGTLWGSGGGIVALKTLSAAIADGDHIRAVIRGDAVNNDGSAKVGFTAPSVTGQSEVIAQALAAAGVSAADISYVEAHGTGTALGDPIELTALVQAFGDAGGSDRCGVGSVKSNIGHLSQGAGVVGLIKTVLALERGVIPPTLNYQRPNTGIDLADTPFYVVDSLTTWERTGRPRRAGVSSFGFGGTNAYVVVEEAPEPEPAAATCGPQLVQLSARTPTARDRAASRLAEHLTGHPELALADVARTLRAGRSPYEHRIAVVAADAADAATALADRKRRLTGAASAPPRVALLFSGQGAQYAGMGSGLYQAEPVYTAGVDEALDVLLGEGVDLRPLLVGDGPVDADEQLRRTEFAQPALFVVEYALAGLWRSWGVEPAAMIGHSIGEYVAATVAGVFTLPDALRLVATRGRLMQALPAGAMLSVQADETDLAGRLPEGVSVAAVNGPGTCVVSGPGEAVDGLAAELEAAEIGSKRLRTSHAFHSVLMEPIRAEFEAAVAAVPRREPVEPVLSNVTGDWLTASEATDPAYWSRHLREPVRFGACVGRLVESGDWAFLECGPGRQLAGLARMQTPRDGLTPQPSLPDPHRRGDDRTTIRTAAGRLWCAGVGVQIPDQPSARTVPLPGYPYERVRHWIDADPGAPAAPVAIPAVPAGGPDRRLPLDDWFSVPVWQQAPPVDRRVGWTRCLLLGGADDLADALRAAGVDVTIAPAAGSREDYATLLTPAPPEHIVYVADGPADQALEQGFFGLLALGQALAGTETPVELDILTRGAADVTGADLLHPEYATAAGLARVLPVEQPAVTVRLVDSDTADPDRLVAELLGTDRPEEIALRGRRRWVQHYEPVHVPAGADPAAGLRDGGVYLITGGLGGIGITLAEDLALRCRARLVLLARSAFPRREEWAVHTASHDDRVSRAIAAIDRIEKAGGEALVLAADVTSVADLRSVRAEIDRRYGRIDGIVHAAGLPGGGLIEVKQRADAEAVLAAKVAGTIALRSVFGDAPLDFVVLCSSVTGVTGGIGQVDYCAANAFLDAHARGPHGWTAGRVVSINWGAWRDVGMAAETAVPDALRALRGSAEEAAGVTEPVEHELLDDRVPAASPQLPTYRADLSPDTHWVLGEHHIAGTPVVPGVALIELARAALADAQPAPGPDARVELHDVEFAGPLVVPEGGHQTVRVELRTEPDTIEFTVASGTGTDEQQHATGSAGWVEPPPSRTVDLAAIRDRCTRRDDLVAEFAGRALHADAVLSLGPRWSGLREVYTGATEELARIDAPAEVVAELGRWVLHPALLDLCTAYGSVGGQHAHLPNGYGRLLVRDPLPATVWSHIRYHDAATAGPADIIGADVTITDDTGRPLVEVGDFTLRRIRGDLGETMTALADRSADPDRAEPPTLAVSPGAIAPAEGAEAFRRLVATDLGPQVVVVPTDLAEVLDRTRRMTVGAAEADAAGSEPGAAAGAADDTGVEATVTRIWAEVLGVDQVEADDDFFDLGGNSLIAIQLIARVRKAVGVKLPMRILFEAPTIGGMLASIGPAGGDAAAVPEPRTAPEDGPAASAPAIQRLPRRG